MVGAVPARTVEPGLLRDAALPLALFSGVTHLGAALVLGLLVTGVVPDGAGGAMLVVWAAFSLFVSLAGYRRMEERRRREAASSAAVSEICVLASRVIALYPRPVDDPAVAEVFDLYRRAQARLEERDHRGAGEAIERGVALADGLLARDGGPVRDEKGRTEGEGERWWK